MINQHVSKMVYLLPYCFLTLVVSSLLFSLVLSIPNGEYLYFLLLSSMTVIPFYWLLFIHSLPYLFNFI